MKNIKSCVVALSLLAAVSAGAQESSQRYIEVSGTSEIEIVPDKIHYIIEIKEYFEEEFDGKSKPEEFKTKIKLENIENDLRNVLKNAGIPDNSIRTEEIGNTWRGQGRDFQVSKRFDITLDDFNKIEKIVKNLDTRGISSMYIGELENNDMAKYQEKGRIEALKAARSKASYMVEALGKNLGDVIRIVENGGDTAYPMYGMQSNVAFSENGEAKNYRNIKKKYSVLVRFEIKD